MTLVLLIMAATGAWARPAYTTFEVGKIIKLGETITPAENLSFNGEAFILDGDYSYTLVRVNLNGGETTAADDGAYYAFRLGVSNNFYGQQCAFTVTGTTDGLVVTAVNDNSITLAVHHIYDPVLQADGTWQFTMPAYNMLLEAEMKDESQTTVTFDGVTPSADTKVKAYMGFEEYFASKLAATVRNLTQDEPVQSPTFTYKTSNPAVIAFDNGTDYPQGAGTLAQMRFYGAGDAELTVQYTGTGDISKSEAALHVTVAQPATLTLVADPTTGGTVEAVIPETGLKVAQITGDMVAGWNTGDYAGELLEAADLEGFQPVSLDVVKQWVGPTTDYAYLYYAFEGTSSEEIEAKYAQYEIGTGEYSGNSSQQVTKSQAYDWALNTQCNYTSYYTLGYTQSNITKNSDGTYSVIPGTSVTLKATPAEGYYLDYWSTNATADEEDKTVATLAVGENATTVTAFFGEKEYEVDLTVIGDDDQGTEKAKWTGKAGEQGTAANFPITAKTGQAVTISYNGRRKVKAVTATTDAEPANNPYANAKLGDLFYSDGTFSTTLEAGKTPIGVIAYLDQEGTDDDEITEKSNGAGHGLVLCLKDAASGADAQWSTEKSAFEFGEDAKVEDVDALKRTTNVSGYTNTKTLAEKTDAATKYKAAYAAKNYTGLTAPTGTTGWFLPSAQQWVKMQTGLGALEESVFTWNSWFDNSHTAADKWEAALSKAGSGNYDSMTSTYLFIWSSSEYSETQAVGLYVGAQGTGSNYGFRWLFRTKDSGSDGNRVRACLAF